MADVASMNVTKEEIDSFIEEQWPTFLEDAARLIKIDSSLDGEHAAPGAPFGPGPRAALDEALAIAKRMGLEVHDGDGYAGYADLPGNSGQQLGVIGHVDVVPAGEGWSFPPFEVTRKDGFLIGRGTSDDKAPVLSALYGLKFWIDRGADLRHTVRFIFGCNEESGMDELPYYLAHHEAPDFLFTPDAEFPLAYGEKGLFGVTLSKELADGALVEFSGGTASNAVPGLASAVVRAVAAALPAADRIAIEPAGEGLARVMATGIPGHASLPEGTVNAIGVLARYLASAGMCSDEEAGWLGFVADMAESTDGAAAGVACRDDDFADLTSVVGIARFENGRFWFTVDIRFPAATTGDALKAAFERLSSAHGAAAEITRSQEPFLVNPDTAPVRALMTAYRDATGSDVKPFTMGGATYAREFPNAVSFGPAEEGVVEKPAWVGGMHGIDEGMAEEELKRAMRVYIRAFGELAGVEDLRG